MFSLPLGEDKVTWTVFLDEGALWERLRTLSHVAVLEGDKLRVSHFLVSKSPCGRDEYCSPVATPIRDTANI
jgi:hypothetical protein